MKKNQNYAKPIGRLSAEKTAALEKVWKMMEKEERKSPAKPGSFTCFVQDASQIDFLKMMMPEGATFRVIR